MSSVIGLAENLRIEIAVPRKESGGTMTLRRLPSLRRATASGVVWSTRRSRRLQRRGALWNRSCSLRNRRGALTTGPWRSLYVWSGAVRLKKVGAGSEIGAWGEEK